MGRHAYGRRSLSVGVLLRKKNVSVQKINYHGVLLSEIAVSVQKINSHGVQLTTKNVFGP